tara:strand:+ start:16540 stop:18246 length:1707 start_codon:yes stop_codon:yes gene_type:complete
MEEKPKKKRSQVEHTMDFDDIPASAPQEDTIRLTGELGPQTSTRHLSTREDHAKKVDDKFEQYQSFGSLDAVDAVDSSESEEKGGNVLPSGTSWGGGGIPSGEFVSAGPAKRTDPLLGQVVNGRFVIKDLLGEGGMGKVYLAEQKGLERPVALKLLHAHIAQDEIRRERFHREAKAMTRFSHPGATAVYDFGEWEGQFYIAMEFLQGRPLSDLVPSQCPLPVHQIVDVLSQVCDALGAAHKAGMIHRDLKPENVMLLKGENDSTQIKLVDFGLALLAEGEGQQRLTQEGMLVGTPAYVSPEQAQGHACDARADIYALGVMLYEMLCGMLPFLGDNMMSLMLQHMFAPAQPPSEKKPDLEIHPTLEALAMQCLAKAPDERPPTCEAFRQILVQALDGETQVSERKRLYEHATRDERASAAGVPHITAPENSIGAKLPKHSIIVVEAPDKAHMESIIVGMWSNGFKARPAEDIRNASTLLSGVDASIVRALVLDITPNPEELLQEVVREKEALLKNVDFIVVGPDDAFTLMSQSLELGAHDYIPGSEVHQRIPKALKRLIKRQARKNKAR